jgi:hypothetical protein
MDDEEVHLWGAVLLLLTLLLFLGLSWFTLHSESTQGPLPLPH